LAPYVSLRGRQCGQGPVRRSDKRGKREPHNLRVLLLHKLGLMIAMSHNGPTDLVLGPTARSPSMSGLNAPTTAGLAGRAAELSKHEPPMAAGAYYEPAGSSIVAWLRGEGCRGAGQPRLARWAPPVWSVPAGERPRSAA